MIIRNKFYHPKTIERKANELLVDYYKTEVNRIILPIQIDKILELHLNLNVLWEKFNDNNILAGLIPIKNPVVLNEDWKNEFDGNRGRENFTKAHEIGHWILHVDHSTSHSIPLPGFTRPYEKICRSDVQDYDEKNADKFASCLLMPRDLMTKEVGRIGNWNDIYNIAEKFKVSVTAMKIRLENLGLLYISDSGDFCSSKMEYLGQKQLL